MGWLRIGHITSECLFQGHKITVYEMRMREDEQHGVTCGWPSIIVHNEHVHNVIPTSNKIKMQLLPFITINNTFSVSVYLRSFFLCLRLFRLRLFCFLCSILSLLDSFYILNHSWTLHAINEYGMKFTFVSMLALMNSLQEVRCSIFSLQTQLAWLRS
jgi:hypothetical protein